MSASSARSSAGSLRVAAGLAVLVCLIAVRSAAQGEAAPKPEKSDPPGSGVVVIMGSEPTWYATSISVGPRTQLLVNYWSKGAYLRAESVVAGHRIISYVKDSTYYAVDVNTNTGVAIERHPSALAEDAGRVRPFGLDYFDMVAGGGEKIETAEIGALRLDVYRLTDRKGRRTVWVTEDPARVVVKHERFDRQSGQTTTTEYLEWLHGMPLQDAFFEPSSDVKLLRYTLEEYFDRVKVGRAGPVPVLYNYLLRGRL